jgi:hypothetical protein
MLNKTQFIKIMNRIEDLNKIQDNVNQEGSPLGISVSMAEPISIALEILESMFNDEGEWIEYYVFDLNYGYRNKTGEMSLSTAGELYDWLIENVGVSENILEVGYE